VQRTTFIVQRSGLGPFAGWLICAKLAAEALEQGNEEGNGSSAQLKCIFEILKSRQVQVPQKVQLCLELIGRSKSDSSRFGELRPGCESVSFSDVTRNRNRAAPYLIDQPKMMPEVLGEGQVVRCCRGFPGNPPHVQIL